MRPIPLKAFGKQRKAQGLKASLALLVLCLLSSSMSAQCELLENDTLMAECGDSVTLHIDQNWNPPGTDFNTGQLDSGWTASQNIDFTSPCGSSPDSTPHLWMGPDADQPRHLASPIMNTLGGGNICFEMRMEEQGNSSPCEGPDLPDEGIHFQYSTDTGNSWTDIYYFNPDTNCCGCGGGCGGSPPSPFLNWDQYCFSIPPAAQTDSTIFRWYQAAGSGKNYDHWGLDNIHFEGTFDDSNLVYDWGEGPTTQDQKNFLPQDSSWKHLMVIDTVLGDTCQDSAYVGYIPLNPKLSPTPSVFCNKDSTRLSAFPFPSFCRYKLHLRDSAKDGWQGAELSVSRNGVPVGYFQASDSLSVFSLTIGPKDSLELEYFSGPNDDENLYYLTDPKGDTLFSDGFSPTNGTAFHDTVTCVDPGGYSFNWDPGSLTTDSTSFDPKVPTDIPNSFRVHIQDTLYAHCSGTDTISIDTISAPDVSLGADTSFCKKGSLELYPDPGSEIHVWNDSLVSDTLIVDSGFGGPVQDHILTGIFSKNCRASDTIQVSLLEHPKVDLGQDTSICANDSLILDGNNYSSHTWQDGSTGQTYLVEGKPAPGDETFYVTATDSDGCQGSDTISISFDSIPQVDLGQDTTVCAGDRILLSSPYAWNQWDNGLLGSAHLVDTAHAGMGTSIHWVLAEDTATGCKARDSVQVEFENCSSLKPYKELGEGLEIHPNPADDKIKIELSAAIAQQIEELLLYNGDGELVKKIPLQQRKKLSVKISGLASGSYYLRTRGQGWGHGTKLIVE